MSNEQSHLKLSDYAKKHAEKRVADSPYVDLDMTENNAIQVRHEPNLTVKQAMELRRDLAAAIQLVDDARTSKEDFEKAEEAYQWEQELAYDDTRATAEYMLESWFVNELVEVWEQEDAEDHS